MAAPVNVSVLPGHIGFGDADAVTPDGSGLIVIVTVTGVASPHELPAVNVYTPAPADVTETIEGFCKADVNPFGPVQLQVVAPVAVPVKFKVALSHTGLVVAPAAARVGAVAQGKPQDKLIQLVPILSHHS